MPTTTPRSTPTDSTPMTAAIAIQKSNGFTRRSRRNSARSIIPKTTASMMIAARTAFGSSEKSGARRIKVARTIATGRERGDRRPGPGGFVQRARRQAGRHGHALEEAGADVRHSLGNRLLVEVDPIPMPRRECLGIARGLGEPDEQEREGRDRDRREVLRHDLDRWHLRKRQASWHGANQRDSLRSQVEEDGPDQPADDEDERPRDPRQREPKPEDDGKGNHADEQRRQAEVAEAPNPRRELLPGIHTVGGGSGELGQLADDDVDRGAGKEPGHDREREEAREPAELEDGDEQEQHPGEDRDRRDQLRRIGCHRGRSGGPRRRQRPRATSSGRSRCAATCRRGRR